LDERVAFLRRGRVVPRQRRFSRVGRWAIAAVCASGSILCVARFFGGPLFALDRFEVSGNQRARTADLLSALSAFRGANLVTLGLGRIADTLAENPWVDRVTLSKRFPDKLTVRVIERRPVALLSEDGRLFWLDAAGRPIAAYDPRVDPAEYVVVRGQRDALAEMVGLLEDLRAKRPDYVAALSEISLLPEGGFGMMDSIFRRPVRVLRRDAPEKIGALLKARGLLESRGWEAQAIDLRFADRIVLVGAYGAGHSL
jgi:cell division protein FtsQ